MASAEQIKALLKSHLSGDDSYFYSVAMQVAAHEAKRGHGKLALELRDLIDAAKLKASKSELTSKPIPLNKPQGELAGLLSVSYPHSRLSDMVLDQSIEDSLNRIIKEQRFFGKIKQHGLSPRRKLLLVGPPGTGKTMTASALAGELGVPLFSVRLDSLITKFMGETAAKLRQIFDAIANVRGIYFFDEFDAIGSQRGQANDVGEIRRVLNSFLQMLEHDNSNSVIIAATNHPEALDYALFRRFDDMIQYGLPNEEQITSILKSRLAAFKPKRLAWKRVATASIGMSYAEISKAIDESLKDAIIQDKTSVEEIDLLSMLEERKLISGKLVNKNNHELDNNGKPTPR
jgi:SpoVK/Ycf46/Vps4 family AAA+-type ATPase